MPWKKSTRSGSDGCVEVNVDLPLVGVRDSKDPHSPVVSVEPGAWKAFIDQVRVGRYDLPTG